MLKKKKLIGVSGKDRREDSGPIHQREFNV